MFKTVLVGVVIAASAAASFADPVNPDERKCPTEVRGVRITSMALRDGVAFMFTVAKPNQLRGLRSLLREAATIVEHESKLASLHPDPDVMPASNGDGSIPALDITVPNTPKGAMVSVRPEEASRIALIQQNARNFELFWSTHTCVDTPKMAARS